MASKRNAAKILRKAAKLIEVHGFVKYSFGSYEHGFCALGALSAAGRGTTAGDRKSIGDRSLAAKALNRRLYTVSGFGSVATYNDLQDTTAQDITKFLRGTARALEHGLVVK